MNVSEEGARVFFFCPFGACPWHRSLKAPPAWPGPGAPTLGALRMLPSDHPYVQGVTPAARANIICAARKHVRIVHRAMRVLPGDGGTGAVGNGAGNQVLPGGGAAAAVHPPAGLPTPPGHNAPTGKAPNAKRHRVGGGSDGAGTKGGGGAGGGAKGSGGAARRRPDRPPPFQARKRAPSCGAGHPTGPKV